MYLTSILRLFSLCLFICCVSSSFARPVYVATAEVNLHQYQNNSSDVLLRIPKGAKVKVMDSSYGNWWQIRYKERIGFAQSTWLKYSRENDRLEYDPIVNASNLYDSKPSVELPSRLPLFEHPKSSSAVLTYLPSGTEVKVVDNNGMSWTMVHFQGRTGYVQKAKLNARPTPASVPSAPITSAPAVASNSVAKASNGKGGSHILIKATSLRKAPDGKSKVLLRFAPGDQVEIIDDSGEWWWEATFKGKKGWVKRRLVEKK